ncbi:16231_t:CDS:2, partial [Racocetra persica]
SRARIIADKQGINLVETLYGFYGSEIIAEYSYNQPNPSDQFLKKKQSADDYGLTPLNKKYQRENFSMKRYDSNLLPCNEDYFSSDSDSEIVSVSLMNIFLETSIEYEKNPDQTAELDISLISIKKAKAEVKSQKTRRPYITHDIVKEILKKYQMCVLAEKKLIYNNVDVLDFVCSNMNNDKITKSSLCIGIINIYNSDCTKFLFDDFKYFIANQLQDSEINVVCFAAKLSIDKFVVDCEKEVLQYLEKFSNIGDLESLARYLNKNLINMSNTSNDLIYTPLLKNVFFRKDDMKLSCGKLASKSYEKLKEILNIVSRSALKLDGKGFFKSLDTEILAQED